MKLNQIALITDFGHDSHYVGVMKGVISGINATAKVIDLCHGIEPQNIKQAAFILSDAINYFSEGTVFCCVVDPGVGSSRRPLVVITDKYYFVAPDNGILTYALEKLNVKKIIQPDRSYFLHELSNTFHCRDVFAPLAAWICRGEEIKGIEVDSDKIIVLPDLCEIVNDDRIEGELIYADRFGNIISSIHKETIRKFLADRDITYEDIEVSIKDIVISGISTTYIDVNCGEYLAYIGSAGYLEIGIRDGNANMQIGNAKSVHINIIK
jgi:S-adenosyl-L-methionine hydrolase (adenosine-forming)